MGRRIATRAVTSLAALLLAASFCASFTVAAELAPALRRPTALALSADESLLFVANRRSGTLSIVDPVKNQVLAETPVGKLLSEMAMTPDQRSLLVTDEAAHELVIVDISSTTAAAPQATVRQRVAVNKYPVSVTATRDGRFAYVTSLWSRRLTVVELPTGPAAPARVAQTLDLPFAPRRMVLAQDDQRLIVADAFAGKLVVLDVTNRAAAPLVLGVREFPGHNIRGLAISHDGKSLVVAHQMLNEIAHTIRNDVHWGLLMSNDLRWLKLDRVLAGGGDLFSGGHMHPLGHAGSATADPSGLAFTPDGVALVTLGGVSEIASGKEADFSLERTPVGKRPTAVIATRDSRFAFVANTFGDSISRVDIANRESLSELSLGPQPELTLVDRGELLFYDGGLSHDGWMSCQSCHTDGHTNGQLNDNFSDKSFGAPKRVLTLLGRADTAPFAWAATSATLPEQIRKSLVNTMQANKEPSEPVVSALAAYIETLESPPSVDALRGVQDKESVSRGQTLFQNLQCVRCHAPPTYTTPKTYDVGIHDKEGNTHFNPPSLRGVGQRAPYFHDNSAADLNEVFRKHGHQLERELSDAELSDLTSFLRSL
ncbi:MAG: cytochrome c peroxidase [Pirellulales bacterium]